LHLNDTRNDACLASTEPAVAREMKDTVCLRVMRKYFLLYFPVTLLLFLFSSAASWCAAPTPETSANTITVRIGKHPEYVRIVLTADDSILQKASVPPRDDTTVRINFGQQVAFQIERKGPDGTSLPLALSAARPVEAIKGVVVNARQQGIDIAVENLRDIRVLKLNNPVRLVVDAVTATNGEVPVPQPPPPLRKKEEDAASPEEHLVVPQALILDPGHGGDDKGISGTGFAEKDIVLGIARDIAAAVSKKGKRVTLTRKGDTSLSLDDRIQFAKAQKNALFVSVHIGSIRECRVYTAAQGAGTEQSETFAQAVAPVLGQELQVPSYVDRLPGLFIRQVPGIALLIELPSPALISYDKAYRDRVVAALIKGLAAALPKEAPKPPPKQPKPKQKLGEEI